MADSFWESLRLGFVQLRADCAIDPPLKSAGRLTALWTAQPEPARWRLDYWNKKDGNGVTQRYKWHAQSAAARLGFAGTGDDAVSLWLDQIRRDAPESHIRQLHIEEGEGPPQLYSFELLDICGLSADYCRKCEADEFRSGLSIESPTDSSTQRITGKSTKREFWKDRQAEFEKYAMRYANLCAHWRAAFGRWIWQWGSPAEDPRNIPEECTSLFNAIARKAVIDLPSSKASGEEEPWRLWLDFMRKREWGFRITANIACTEREWDAGVKDGKPLVQVRREQKYTIGDEGTNVYRRLKNGKLRRLSARELEGKNSESIQKYYHWLEDGIIERVFQSSADLCEDLAARAFVSSEKTTQETNQLGPVASGGDGSPSESNKKKKRGRPQTITDEKKAAAVKLKSAGGTNKEVAAVLYGTKHPTAQQKKNVPAILRHHQHKSKQAGSNGHPPQGNDSAP